MVVRVVLGMTEMYSIAEVWWSVRQELIRVITREMWGDRGV